MVPKQHIPWPISAVASRRRVEHQLLYLADCGLVSGGECAGLVVPVRVVHVLAAHAAAEAASPASPVRPVWQPYVAGRAISSILPVVAKLFRKETRENEKCR